MNVAIYASSSSYLFSFKPLSEALSHLFLYVAFLTLAQWCDAVGLTSASAAGVIRQKDQCILGTLVHQSSVLTTFILLVGYVHQRPQQAGLIVFAMNGSCAEVLHPWSCFERGMGCLTKG